jgi:hypothetical protein
MAFSLVKSFDNIGFYGRIPEPLPGYESNFEEWPLSQSDLILLNDDFVDPVNDLCGTLLDYGDVDFFNTAQCEILKCWLENRIAKQCDCRLSVMYEKLLEFADRAIELGTGVVVEL